MEGTMREPRDGWTGREVAVVGMSGRFPGAGSIADLWRNLCAGVESVTFFSREEMEAAGADPRLLDDPRWVGAKAVLAGEDLFDAAFFGMSAREAEILDPQHRIFLECAWEALEHAGIDPGRFPGPIGVYAGVGSSSYAWSVLARNPGILASVGAFQVALSNDKDYLPTRVSYKLDLRGPSFSVQSACSTSLVAISLAAQSLLAWECDAALAGAVTIGIPQRTGYLYQEGGILSPDGHCRTFDARARGTAPGSGAGVVVLKRLVNAVADGDFVWAVIKGTAVNNDGAQKVGYTAPSVEGQAEVIAAAQAMAGVDPASITYVEAHGTATPLGDPIEIAALTQAFRDGTDERGFCAVGSVKSNFGHLDAAAGVAGFLKTVLALHHRRIPPSLHFEAPNPAIDFASSPFYVNTRLARWETGRLPRRAGVSSFGIGGTNAHVVLEEAPEREPSEEGRPAQLLLLSAKTETALERTAGDLADFLEGSDLDGSGFADVAWTLQTGRRPFAWRRAVVCRTPAEAVAALRGHEPARVAAGLHEAGARPVAFLFPGQGAQHVDMARELYETEPVFGQELDRAAEILEPLLSLDLREVLFPAPAEAAKAQRQLQETRLTQPALFAVEHAMAQLWRSWGISPAALLGHSVGELVAACLAGVFSLEDGLALVAARGRLMQGLPPGAMLAVSLPEAEVLPLLGGHLSLAAVNAPGLVTVSGPEGAVAALAAELARREVRHRRLLTSHAFHSGMVEPVLAEWEREVRSVALRAPEIPFVSNVTGRFVTAEEATDPRYWVRHLREVVRFSDGLRELLADPGLLLLEVGPGRTLATLARQHPEAAGRTVVSSLAHPQDGGSDLGFSLLALGRLWIAGAEVDWARFHAGARRLRVPLPTYPFERRRYWIEAGAAAPSPATEEGVTAPAAASHPRPSLGTAYVPPRNGAEREIAAIWEELLGISPVGRYDDFFELGGSSLLAVSLMARIEERLGSALPVSALVQAPTVDSLARQARVLRPASPLVELEPGEGEGTPVFLVHPVGGNVLAYLELARRLGRERAVWAFQAGGLADGAPPRTSVEDMAEDYLGLLREVRPRGPWVLGGWSFGGLVAFEMARRLESEGEEVELLVLLDSAPVPPETAAAPPGEAELLAWFLQDLSPGRPAADGEGLADLSRLDAEARLDLLLAHAREAGLLPEKGGRERLRRLLALFQANAAAAARYRPGGPFGGDVLLLAAAQGVAGGAPSAVRAWGDLLAGSIAASTLPGNHYTLLLAPQVGEVAERIGDSLKRRRPERVARMEDEPCLGVEV
jgi:phthiocerol/phenolphthiocerol synthesis type-I polyketide synthase E